MPRGIPSDNPYKPVNLKLEQEQADAVSEFQAQLRQEHRINFKRADVIRRLIADGLAANGVTVEEDDSDDED